MTRTPLAGIPIRAARWSATHPWRAIGAWLVLVAVAVALAATVSTHRAQDADYRVGESGRAAAMIERAGLDEPPSESVLITGRGDRLDAAALEAASREVARRLSQTAGVASVGDPITSPDRTAVLVPVELTSPDIEAQPLLDATSAVQADHLDVTVREVGDVTIDAAINDRVAEDLHSAEIISLPITLVLMLLAFGALIAAGLPVLLAATSVAATIGITAPISHLVPAEDTVYSMIVLIGMAVGVDYSLFYLKRERQERAAGRTHLDAVTIAAETSGHAILVSGGAVIAALSGLFVLTDVTFNSLATGSILVVAIAVLGSITVLPALLAKLGRWVDRPRLPLLWRLTRRVPPGTVSGRILGPVVRHPVAALLVAAVGILALAVPALTMKTHQASIDTLPQDLAPVQTMRAITAAFPSEGTTATVVVTGADPQQADEALRALATRAAATGGFVDERAHVRTSQDGSTSVIDLAMPWDETDSRASAAIERLRDDLVPAALGG
ncbi:MAG: MMPL family transporter, partial [Nocardioidaceae bacterium]|nr:MMPL family transporter [Nocardioidaceae bacterium]